jgi:hypothetical protein
MINIDIEHFKARLLQDALTTATTAYWVHRAYQFQQAAPRADEYHGNATVEELRERWWNCMNTSLACRRHADLLRDAYPEPISDEVAAVLDEVA